MIRKDIVKQDLVAVMEVVKILVMVEEDMTTVTDMKIESTVVKIVVQSD